MRSLALSLCTARALAAAGPIAQPPLTCCPGAHLPRREAELCWAWQAPPGAGPGVGRALGHAPDAPLDLGLPDIRVATARQRCLDP